MHRTKNNVSKGCEMKRLLFLIALFACMAMAHVKRPDAVYIDGKHCSFSSYPLNEFISNHYSEWPFRPTFSGPGDGGGYWGFWSIRDSLLYLDSLTINTWWRSSIVMGNGKRMHFSVRIPLQEIIRNSLGTEPRQLLKDDESLYAYFVNDMLEVSCLDDLYTFYVKNGRVHLLKREPNDLIGEKKKSRERSRQKKTIRPYREGSSPFAAYYFVLDNLRKKRDENDKEIHFIEVRQNSIFKRFEEFFDINAVDSWRSLKNDGSQNMAYTLYVTPKEKTPFREIVFIFVMDGKTHKFKVSPVDAVELFEKSYAAICKNPSFVRWLQEKKSKMNYRDVRIERDEKISALYRVVSRDEVWKNTGMPGNYVASLTLNGVIGAQYKFMLNDDGDILVPWAIPPKGENFLNVANDADENWVRMKHCREPVVGEKEPSGTPLFCDYVIIRHDGKVEYGPKSEKP